MDVKSRKAEQSETTRAALIGAARPLFAERGYEHVAVSDVAREAEVAEATLYNYFQTKEQLVTDREYLGRKDPGVRGAGLADRDHGSGSYGERSFLHQRQ